MKKERNKQDALDELVEQNAQPVVPLTQVILVKAVIVYDDQGSYFIHGTSKDDASTMFKAMAPIWGFDPSKELAHEIELELEVATIAGMIKPRVV